MTETNYNNIISLRPEFSELINSVPKETLMELFQFFSPLTDISIKSFSKTWVSSLFTLMYESTTLYEYVIEKYNVSFKDKQELLLELNKISSQLTTLDLPKIYELVEIHVNKFVEKYVSEHEKLDSTLVETLWVTLKEPLNQRDFLKTLLSEMAKQIFDDNLVSKSIVLQIIIDSIQQGLTKEEIAFRLNNVFENE